MHAKTAIVTFTNSRKDNLGISTKRTSSFFQRWSFINWGTLLLSRYDIFHSANLVQFRRFWTFDRSVSDSFVGFGYLNTLSYWNWHKAMQVKTFIDGTRSKLTVLATDPTDSPAPNIYEESVRQRRHTREYVIKSQQWITKSRYVR